MLRPIFLAIGVVWVILFFIFASKLSKSWIGLSEKKYVRKLFVTALLLRIFWVIFSYVFYTIETGVPFEYGSSDAWEYHNAAVWFNEIGLKNAFFYMSQHVGLSDRGYPIYLMFLYLILGPNVILARFVKALLGAWTCVLMYKLAQRNFGDNVGRMAGLFGCLMPNLIIYCGMHLKEIEMLFMVVACLERADKLFHEKTINYWNVLIVGVLGFCLFTFRTVLGATVMFAIFTAVVFTRTAALSRWNRITLVLWAICAIAVFAGGTVSKELQKAWNGRSQNQELKRYQQVRNGVSWAQYATGTVMAPMMFVLPFPTMVDVDDQYNQQLVNGGNYVRNFLGIFVIITVFNSIFRRRNWRDFALVGSYVISYLAVVCFSGFANAERFLLPGLPGLLIMAAYGVSIISKENIRWVKVWYWVVPVMILGWAVFKLGARGIL